MMNSQDINENQIYELNPDSSQSSEDDYKYRGSFESRKIDTQFNENNEGNIFSYYQSDKYRERSISGKSDSEASNHASSNEQQQLKSASPKIKSHEQLDAFFQPSGQSTRPKKLNIDKNNGLEDQFIRGRKYVEKYEEKQLSDGQADYEIGENKSNMINEDGDLTPQLKKKRKRKHKIFTSKYVIKQKNVALSKEEQLSLEEQIAMNKVYFEKKRENHKELKTWNYKRIRALESHRRVMDEISKNVDEKMSQSLKNFELYQQFFRERAAQEQKYLKNAPSGLAEQLQQKQINEKIYICPSSLLISTNEKFNSLKNQQINRFIKLVRQDILKTLFEEYYMNINKKKMIEARHQISVLKKELQNIETQVANKLIKLESKFAEASNNVTQHKSDISHDFFMSELSFLRKCCLEMEYQVLMAHKIIEYCEIVKEEEKRRARILKEGLLMFERGQRHKDVDGGSIQKKNEDLQFRIEQMAKDEQDQLIEEFYSFEQLLCEKIIEDIKKSIHQNLDHPSPQKKDLDSDSQNLELSSEQFFCFFTQYPLKFDNLFNCRHLIIKQFKIQMLSDTTQEAWQKTKLMITIDKYVHILPLYQKQDPIHKAYHKPYYTMRANFIEVEYQGSLSEKPKKVGNQEQHQQQSQSGGQSCSENESESTLNCFIVKLVPKKNWKNFLFEGNREFKKIKFYMDQDLSQFEDYLLQFSA